MKISKFRLLSLILTLLLLTAGISGCNIGYGREFERVVEGDFIVIDFSDYDQELYIEGLSEAGKEKTIIVVPEFLRGKRVTGFNHSVSNDGPGDGYWRSDKLEKVYIIPKYTLESSYVMDDMRCRNLKKVITINQEVNYHGKMGAPTYFSRKWFDIEENEIKGRGVMANISYYWNYENCPNNGYYWLDDIDYGTKITFIPDAPQREGFVFGGWFKEEGCESKWDFETDAIPEALKDGEENIIYQETILYAKWTAK